MSLTYSTFVSSIANLAAVPTSDVRYQQALPNIIDDLEQRLYRELDLLNTLVDDSSSVASLNTRVFNLPTSTGTFVVLERINIITPAGQTNPDLGTRNPVTPASKEMLDFMWPSAVGSTVPQYFAMRTQNQVLFGPYPDQAYTVEVSGTQRPAPLSTTNVTTLLSVYFPDLTIAAGMVAMSAEMKNWGAMADDPKMAQSWEAHYQQLIQSAQVEEARKKFTSQGWSSKQPAQLATPPRT